MRPEGNPLDLNNLPEDFTRDGKQVQEDSSSSAAGYRKKKSGAKEGKDESGKVYECRFCSLKFPKSQALGGHMNRHRQERETEALNEARQLVFSNDNLLAQGPHQLGQSFPQGGYHQTGSNIGDPTLTYRSIYPPTLFSGPPPPQPPPPQSYMSRLISYPSHYPPPPMNDYLLGHVLPSNTQYGPTNPIYVAAPSDTNYTCIGAPVGHGFVSTGGGDTSLNNQVGGSDMLLNNRVRPYTGTHQCLDSTSTNRYQDGF